MTEKLDPKAYAVLGDPPALPTKRPRGRPPGPVNQPRNRSAVADPKYTAARIRVANAQAQKVELANAKARGELVKASEVQREWEAVLRDVRAAMLALPSRVGTRLPKLSPTDVAAIDDEIRSALTALGNGSTN